MAEEARRLWRPRQITEAFGITKSTLHRLISEGRLSASKLDGLVFVRDEDLQAFLRRELRPIEPAASQLREVK